VWHTFEDPAVPVKNSLDFAAALCKAGVPCELHIYERGNHGIGLAGDAAQHHRWADDCRAWLHERQFAK
jgi:dipeptidyl aminopeptidase/acylaminoacyl peptidase